MISDKNEGYTKLSQLKGKVIGVVSSRPGEIMVREALEGKATIVEYENETEVKRALKDQHVDYIVIDELPAKLLVERLNGEKQ
ncbi:MAG: transporter substrate-binding domain-containing protein [Clostridia bacterium]|nr:transporter substrate-binding domain-containing protein [Clostridia bacterium]